MPKQSKSDFHDLAARALNGEDIPFSRYRGKVVLVVNTASRCGLTSQYAELQALHVRYADDGLVILGFPCNQFGGQEPGERDSIEACLVNYGVDFQMFEKIDVNGRDAHPVFRWLKAALPGLIGSRVMWNFTKFLVGRDGRPLGRYAPVLGGDAIEPDIVKALRGD